MSEPKVSKGYLASSDKFPAGWMLKSGQRTSQGPRVLVSDEILLFTHGPEGRVVMLEMDVHDAGELYTALEAHMENVAAPPAPDFRESNLKAFREEIDNPLRAPVTKADMPTKSGVTALVGVALNEQERATLAVVDAWTAKTGPFAKQEIRSHWPSLAAALDNLAKLLP